MEAIFGSLAMVIVAMLGVVGTLAVMAAVIAIARSGGSTDSFDVRVSGRGHHGVNAASGFLSKITKD